MKKINMIMIWVVLFLARNTYADINSLFKGVAVNDTTLNELATTTTPDAFSYGISWLAQETVGGGTVDAFLKVPNSTNLYSLSSKLKLYHTNFDTRTLLAHWPLTTWPHYTRLQEESKRLSDNGLDYSGFGFGAKRPVGCLDSTPLRYGDIFSDGTPELALFISNDFVLFSPQYNRIVFATWLSVNDWMTLKETDYIYTDEGRNVSKPTTVPQYDSWYANTFRMLGGVPGYRGYSKIYIDDLDEDDHQDIIVWKKLYVSKLENDLLRGFTFVRNQFEHYEADLVAQAQLPAGVTGEYLLQATDQTTIQTWLTTKKLTWQKGYPSQSECPGQENQLIPEMHDPLLNDPDVLK